MRKLKIMEHVSLDGVIQHSADDDHFPYSDWTGPYRTPAGRDALLAAYDERFDLLLGRRTYDLSTVRRVLNGVRSRALDRTSSRGFAASSRRATGALSSGQLHADIDAARARARG